MFYLAKEALEQNLQVFFLIIILIRYSLEWKFPMLLFAICFSSLQIGAVVLLSSYHI